MVGVCHSGLHAGEVFVCVSEGLWGKKCPWAFQVGQWHH